MSIEFNTERGKIEVSYDVIGTIVGAAVSEVYGVVGMTSKKITDGIKDVLKQDNLKKGIHIVKNESEEMEINVHVVVLYGTKISEIAHNIQEKTKYELEQMLGLNVSSINVFVEDVRVSK